MTTSRINVTRRIDIKINKNVRNYKIHLYFYLSFNLKKKYSIQFQSSDKYTSSNRTADAKTK